MHLDHQPASFLGRCRRSLLFDDIRHSRGHGDHCTPPWVKNAARLQIMKPSFNSNGHLREALSGYCEGHCESVAEGAVHFSYTRRQLSLVIVATKTSMLSQSPLPSLNVVFDDGGRKEVVQLKASMDAKVVAGAKDIASVYGQPSTRSPP